MLSFAQKIQLSQNEGEVANGGRDDGSSLEAVEQAEQELDRLLRLWFGAGWDLKVRCLNLPPSLP